MFVRLTAAAMMLSLGAAPGVAQAADKALRTLSFDVGYSVASSSERKENGITSGGGSGGAFNVDDAGTMVTSSPSPPTAAWWSTNRTPAR